MQNAVIKKIKVKVLLFASLRDLFNKSDVEVTLDEKSTILDLRNKVFEKIDTKKKEGRWKTLMYAVNQNYASLETILKDGDEVAFLPFVSGG